MRIETRTVYVSDDGREFDNELDCRVHEKTGAIVHWLATCTDIDLATRYLQEIIDTLLVKYDITERKE